MTAITESALVAPIVVSTGAELGHPCAVCNDLAAQAPGDLCGFCSLTAVVVCTRCGGVQEQYGPCIHCESGR